MKDVWAAAGWERGPLGYPTAPEIIPPPGGITFQDFENGYLCMQTNLGAFSRTVIQPRSVIALPVIMIAWGDLGRRLPDNDVISVAFAPARNPNGNITLTLNAAPSVTWWKAISIWSVSRGTIAETFTQGASKTGTMTVKPGDIDKNDSFIVFKKAKALGVHTDMYWLTPTQLLLGRPATFTWSAD